MMNIGIINETLIKKAIEENNNQLYESFINIVSDSDYLMSEYVVFNNIKNFNILESTKANLTDFIKENIELLKSYKPSIIKVERKKLVNFLSYINEENTLFQNIGIIIEEQVVRPKNKSDIAKAYNSYNNIFNILTEKKTNITDNKTDLKESITYEELDSVLKNMEKIFVQKYSTELSEDEQKILAVVINGNNEDKKILFEELKTKALNSIEESKEDLSQHIYESSKEKIMTLPQDNVLLESSLLDLIEILY